MVRFLSVIYLLFSAMAWRFKASKYKNAAPKVPKFEEMIRDLSLGAYMSHGNFISASAAYMAFNWDTHGTNLAVLPIDTKGRQNKTAVPLIYAHPEFVTDFQFSPFDDGLLATGSVDATVRRACFTPQVFFSQKTVCLDQDLENTGIGNADGRHQHAGVDAGSSAQARRDRQL